MRVCENKIVRINSRLYFDLFNKGGDKLISTYCILKSNPDAFSTYYSFKSGNNKEVSGFNILRSKTNLTLHTLKKYVPILIDMGLCYFNHIGNFVLIGNNKTNTLYNSKKIIPIKIGKNLTDTAYNCISIRIHSAQKQQQKQIIKKQNQKELLSQVANPKNSKSYRQAVKLKKQLNGLEIEITDKTVLSNKGYAVIKDGTTDNKSKGSYWKNVLKNKGIVETKRQYKKIRKISIEEFNSLKNNGLISSNLSFYRGYLVEELISMFFAINIIC